MQDLALTGRDGTRLLATEDSAITELLRQGSLQQLQVAALWPVNDWDSNPGRGTCPSEKSAFVGCWHLPERAASPLHTLLQRASSMPFRVGPVFQQLKVLALVDATSTSVQHLTALTGLEALSLAGLNRMLPHNTSVLPLQQLASLPFLR